MEIKEIIQKGESKTVEFKENFDKETIETAVAFANTNGGIVLIGVADNGKIRSIQVGRETLRGWANQISQSTEPMVIPEIKDIQIGGKSIVEIQIKEYPIKPVSTRGRCFRRVGNSNRVMTPQEIAQMHLISTGTSWDALPARGSSIDDIDLEKVKKYIKNATAGGRRKFEEKDDPFRILEKLELLKEKKPTWAAVLLFGKDPQGRLSQSTVHCGRFKQETIIIDDRMVRGNVLEQVEEVIDFIRKNISVRFAFTGKPKREEIWDYPLEALREAVINAVCHRDYADNSDIQIKVHDDRITIWNPGGLLPGMTVEELYDPNHTSKPRNKLIAQIFYDVELIERYGSGIQRIIEACKKSGLPAPVFEERFGGFLVIFRKDIYTEEYLEKLGLNERQIKAVMYVKEKEKITNGEYQELNTVSKRTATRDLNDLVERNILEQIGITGKGTEYIIKGAKGVKNGSERGQIQMRNDGANKRG
jgi:ATP-dependent DNA helicase RecG